METVDGVEVFDDDIEFYFNEFCEKYNIDDMTNETQNRFNACMIYIYKHVFKGTNKLKYNPNINNTYNVPVLNNILDCYLNLCFLYSKECSIGGYSKLTGIDYQTFLEWSHNQACDGFGVYKRIMQENENSNSDLLSSGRNPVGIMARLNHVHNWSAQQVQAETIARSISAAELPNFQNAKQIEEK